MLNSTKESLRQLTIGPSLWNKSFPLCCLLEDGSFAFCLAFLWCFSENSIILSFPYILFQECLCWEMVTPIILPSLLSFSILSISKIQWVHQDQSATSPPSKTNNNSLIKLSRENVMLNINPYT